MYKLEFKLKDIILQNVEFKVDNKVIKKGKVKVFNTKQFFIRFKLDNNGIINEYDLPYPFRVEKNNDGYLFDYCLSAFCPRTEELYWKILSLNKDDASKLHNNYLNISIF
jgi:hypothetical protein